jgi:hypothetical protein
MPLTSDADSLDTREPRLNGEFIYLSHSMPSSYQHSALDLTIYSQRLRSKFVGGINLSSQGDGASRSKGFAKSTLAFAHFSMSALAKPWSRAAHICIFIAAESFYASYFPHKSVLKFLSLICFVLFLGSRHEYSFHEVLFTFNGE